MKSRIWYIDLLRTMAAIAVVFYHCEKNLVAEQVLLIFLNWCVPIFLMISGALFFSKSSEITVVQMLKGPVKRILVILVVWGMVYNTLSLLITKGIHIDVIVESVLMVLVADTSFCYQFWYLYMLVGLYIAIPILKPWADRTMRGDKPNQECIILFGFVFFVSIFIPTIMQIVGYNGTIWKNGFIMYSAYAFYLMCGYGVYKWGIERKLRAVIFGTWGAQALWIIFNIWKGDYSANSALYGYTSIFTWEMSVLLFDLARRTSNIKVPEKIKSVISYISFHSMGVYILHVMILMGISKIKSRIIPNLDYIPILYSIFTVILTILICLICSRCIEKTRLGKKIL